MSNCLFEAAYETILKRCNCTPSFHQLAYKDYPDICRGPGLTCMNNILRFIGKLNRVSILNNLPIIDDKINKKKPELVTRIRYINFLGRR